MSYSKIYNINYQKLFELDYLNICNKKLTNCELKYIHKLQNLEDIMLANNEIKKIPKNLGRLKKLNQIWLNSSQIDDQ